MKKKTSAMESMEIVPAGNNVSGIIPAESLSEAIYSKYYSISGTIETNLEARNMFVEGVALHELREKVIHDGIVAGVNIYKELNDFLSSRKSVITGENYHYGINVFLKYCENEKIEPLRVTRKDSEKYLKHLNENYAPGTVRTMTMAVCSFYQYIMRHHEKLFVQNVFLKLELPNNIPFRKKDIVCVNDIKVLRKEFLKDGRDYMVCLLDIVSKHGLRVGTFLEMEIDKKGNWRSVSKGKSARGTFTKDEVKQIRDSKLLEKSLSTLKNIFKKYTKELYERGAISCDFSIHDLRHYVITKNVKTMKIDDFLKFSRGFHKNPSTTLSYYNE